MPGLVENRSAVLCDGRGRWSCYGQAEPVFLVSPDSEKVANEAGDGQINSGPALDDRLDDAGR
jgi:hypothetical protein